MTHMQYYLNLFYGIMLLRNTPHDLPASKVLFWLSLMLLFGMGMLQGTFIFPPLKSLAFNVFSLTLLLLFLHFLLSFYKRLQFFWQAAAAILGVDCLFRLLQLPAYIAIQGGFLEKDDPLIFVPLFLLLMVFVYSIFVFAHILRHVLSVTTLVSVLLVLAYDAMTYVLIGIVFPYK